jgi:hypothetical protein
MAARVVVVVFIGTLYHEAPPKARNPAQDAPGPIFSGVAGNCPVGLPCYTVFPPQLNVRSSPPGVKVKHFLLSLLFISSASCTSIDAAEDVSGPWILQMERDFRDNPGPPVECTFKQRRSQLTVKCGTGVEMKGEVSGHKLTWGIETTVDGDRLVLTYSGDLNTSGTKVKGIWRIKSSTLDKKGNFGGHKRQ